MNKTLTISKRPVIVNYKQMILANVKRQTEVDPTRTVTLRRAFVNDMVKRFNKLSKEVIEAIVNKDVFGLIEPVRVFADLGEKQFKFKTSQQKVEAFMDWLREREKAGILKTTTINQLGTSIEQPWTNVYIEDSYKRGVMRATAEVKKIKVPMPGMTDEPLQATMANPFHAERVGVLYSRAFEELKGITSNMDQQISRVLSEGLVNGDNPRLLARKLNKVITGAGGDLSLKDSLGRFIPAKRRAEMLARTEIIRAHHQATIQQYRNYGIAGVKVKAEWATAGDNRVCPECEKLQRKVFTLDEIQGMIPVHPNCRCLALPSLIEESTIQKLSLSESINNEELLIKDAKIEYGVGFDNKGQVLFKQKGEKSTVVFTKEQSEMLKGNILTHNHPSGNSFSFADFEVLLHRELQQIRAVSSQRNGTYIMSLKNDADGFAPWAREGTTRYKEKIYQSYERAVENTMFRDVENAYINSFPKGRQRAIRENIDNIPMEEITIFYYDIIWKKVAKEFSEEILYKFKPF